MPPLQGILCKEQRSGAGDCNLPCIVKDGLPLQSVHLWDSVAEVLWGVLGTVAQGTNFNGVVLHIQTLSMQVIGDFQIRYIYIYDGVRAGKHSKVCSEPNETNALGHQLGTEFSAEMVGSLGQLESQSLPQCVPLPCSIAREVMERDHTTQENMHAF